MPWRNSIWPGHINRNYCDTAELAAFLRPYFDSGFFPGTPISICKKILFVFPLPATSDCHSPVIRSRLVCRYFVFTPSSCRCSPIIVDQFGICGSLEIRLQCVDFRSVFVYARLLEGQGVSSVLWIRFPGVRGVEARPRTLKDSHF